MTVLVLIKKIKVECRNYPQNNLVYDVNTDCYVLTNYMNSLYKSTSNIFFVDNKVVINYTKYKLRNF